MKPVSMEINGNTVTAEEGMTLLAAAQQAGIPIPTLCHHEALKACGACRLCVVEITTRKGRKRIVASCSYPVEEGLAVQTNTDRIRKIRKVLIELLWPASKSIAAEYGITESRFEPKQPDCNMCGLCVRYCEEVVKKSAVYFRGRGVEREIAFTPGMENACVSCRACFELCTGGWIVNESNRAYISTP